MKGYLLDTNVVSELIKPKPNPNVVRWVGGVHEPLLYLSVLTLGEIRKGIVSQTEAHRRHSLESWLSHALVLRFEGRILEVDREIADRWGRMNGASKQPLPVIDSLLAATAVHHDLVLVTRDVRSIEATGVELLNPWNP